MLESTLSDSSVLELKLKLKLKTNALNYKDFMTLLAFGPLLCWRGF